MVSIPDSVFQAYKDAADDLISQNFGINCRLVYPHRKIQCDNCIYDPVGQKSSNRYKHGGPAPFNFGHCPTCGGAGYKEDEQSEIIKMRVYFGSDNFKEVAPGVDTQNADAQVIGFIYDLPKFERANEIICHSDLENYGTFKFRRASQAFPHGLQKDRYFIAFLTRI